MPALQITVLKRVLHQDLVHRKLPESVASHVTLCPVLREGQVFFTESVNQIPGGFCVSAWGDIVRKIGPQLAEEPDSTSPFYLCCMDGLRPVTFEVKPTHERGTR